MPETIDSLIDSFFYTNETVYLQYEQKEKNRF